VTPKGSPAPARRFFLRPARSGFLVGAFGDAALAAGIGAVLFVPILGLVLDRTGVTPHLERAAAAVALLFAGRLAVALAVRTGAWARLTEGAQRAGAPLWTGWSRGWRALAGRPRTGAALALAALAVFPFSPFANGYLLHVLSLTFIYILLAMGLNIVVGLAGLLDLGFVAFYAVGAYGYALLAQHAGVSFWLAIPLTAAIAACAGFLLGFPVLRMHGDYLAIVTLGFGEIVRMLLVNLTGITGGPNGLATPRPTLFGLAFTASPPAGTRAFHEAFGLEFSPSHRSVFLYLAILAFMLGAVWVFQRLKHMPIGRAWEALKENEVAARATGIDPTVTKLAAFMLGASFAGVGGVCFAGLEGFVNPSSFTFIESAMILAMVVLGGMGSVAGVILAAVGITVLPEVFREFGSYRMLVFGLAMVCIMVWRPEGLLRVARRSLERSSDAA